MSRYADINRALLLEAGATMKLAKATATRLLEDLRSRIEREVESLYVETEAENARLAGLHPELAATFAGELRCLRAIQHSIIADMAGQLR